MVDDVNKSTPCETVTSIFGVITGLPGNGLGMIISFLIKSKIHEFVI